MIGDVGQLDEEIDNYWAALDEGDRKWSVKEEENSHKLLTGEILTKEQYSRLLNMKPTKGATLQGVHSYDILANPLYLDNFQYVTAAEEDRDALIIDNTTSTKDDSA